MPKWEIAVSKQTTKCDTIWRTVIDKVTLYIGTDGTPPSQLDEPWETYLLGVNEALRLGVEISLDRDNYGFPFRFPRPPFIDGASVSVGMTGRMLMEFMKQLRIDRNEPDLIFPLTLGDEMYVSGGEKPIQLDTIIERRRAGC